MTPLQKNILAACKHRPQTLRELQNALQVDNSRLRNTVTGMVATGMLSARNGIYVPWFHSRDSDSVCFPDCFCRSNHHITVETISCKCGNPVFCTC